MHCWNIILSFLALHSILSVKFCDQPFFFGFTRCSASLTTNNNVTNLIAILSTPLVLDKWVSAASSFSRVSMNGY